jgi:hypothetical protein
VLTGRIVGSQGREYLGDNGAQAYELERGWSVVFWSESRRRRLYAVVKVVESV